jgi:hypothetical protein
VVLPGFLCALGAASLLCSLVASFGFAQAFAWANCLLRGGVHALMVRARRRGLVDSSCACIHSDAQKFTAKCIACI